VLERLDHLSLPQNVSDFRQHLRESSKNPLFTWQGMDIYTWANFRAGKGEGGFPLTAPGLKFFTSNIAYRITEKRCTRYIDCTANPRWEQSFTFNVAEEELSAHKIKLSAWDYFQPKQNMFIGTAIIDLSSEF